MIPFDEMVNNFSKVRSYILKQRIIRSGSISFLPYAFQTKLKYILEIPNLVTGATAFFSNEVKQFNRIRGIIYT